MKLYYFTEDEFNRAGRNWFADMDQRLLVLLDVFRHQWGSRVEISAHDAALGRLVDASIVSDHNFTRHGVVLAADVLPSGMASRAAASRALEIARRTGFTAIGLYPHWKPAAGLHLGVRNERRIGDPARWGAVSVAGKQTYGSLEKALEAM